MKRYRIISIIAVVFLLPLLSIIQARANDSITESLSFSTKAPEQLFANANESTDLRTCILLTQCEERMGCDPDLILPYSAPIPQGYFVGCSAALQDASGKLWYFNFIDNQWLTERSQDGVTVGNMNPHMMGAPITIEIDESLEDTNFTLLHISYLPWPSEAIPCDEEIAYQCATVTPHVYNLPVVFQP